MFGLPASAGEAIYAILLFHANRSRDTLICCMKIELGFSFSYPRYAYSYPPYALG